jgi:hypothetical protein
MVLADTFCTISICFKVSMAVVPTEEGHRFVVGLAVQIITTYITAAITQLSFCNLYYILWVPSISLFIIAHPYLKNGEQTCGRHIDDSHFCPCEWDRSVSSNL